MNLELIEQAKTLTDPVAAEKLAAKSGGEFHPIVCDVLNEKTGGCKHVSARQREGRVAAYAKAQAKAKAKATA